MYILCDFSGTFGGNCYTINELQVFDKNNNLVSYTIRDVYDKVKNGVPAYWNSNIWDKSNLNDGSTGYGEQYSTLFGYNSTSTDPNVKWARLVIEPSSDDISFIRVYTSNNINRSLTTFKVYTCNTYNHTTNLVNRDDTGLEFIGSWSTTTPPSGNIYFDIHFPSTKLLFADESGNVYTFDDNKNLVSLNKTTSDLVEDDFRNNGKFMPYFISKSELQQISDNVKLLYKPLYGEYKTNAKFKVVSYPEVVVSKSLVYLDDGERVDSIVLTNNQNTDIRLFVSEDLRTWKYWDGSQWVIKQTLLPVDAFGDESILRFYKFESNANDETNNHGDGTWYGNEQYEDGYIDKAAKFDGTSYISISQPITQALYTITGWIKTSQVAHGNYYWDNPSIICRTQAGTATKDISIQIRDGYAHFWHKYYPSDQSMTTDKYVSDDRWHFFALVKDTNEVRLYIDNNTPDSLPCNTTDAGDSIDWNIGVVIDGNGSIQPQSYFIGLLDHLRIFNRVLTESEIQQLYDERSNLTLSDFDDAMLHTTMNNLTWNEWKQFFTGETPTQIGFAFKLEDIDDSHRNIINKITIQQLCVKYRDVTNDTIIEQTRRKIFVTFNQDGEYKINYLD